MDPVPARKEWTTAPTLPSTTKCVVCMCVMDTYVCEVAGGKGGSGVIITVVC